MKRLFAALMLSALSIGTFAQTVKFTEGNDLKFLKDKSSIAITIDYSKAVIMGMTEQEFGNEIIAQDSIKRGEARQQIVEWKKYLRGRLIDRFNYESEGKIQAMLNEGHESQCSADVLVLSVDTHGNLSAEVIIKGANGESAKTLIKGEGGNIGTRLALFGDGMRDLGEQMAKAIRKYSKGK